MTRTQAEGYLGAILPVARDVAGAASAELDPAVQADLLALAATLDKAVNRSTKLALTIELVEVQTEIAIEQAKKTAIQAAIQAVNQKPQ